MRIETAVIEVINTCNLRCKHCYGQFEKQVVMPINKYELYLKQLYDYGMTRLTITGGEPFLMGDNLFDYVYIAKKMGIPHIVITTNGTIHYNNIVKLIDNINLLQISIDGDENTHDYIRGQGTYKKSTSFIENAADVDNKKVCIMMSLHKMNFLQLQNVHQYAKSKNISFAIEIVTPCGRGSNIDVINKKQMLYVQNYIRENRISCNDPINFCDKNSAIFFNQDIIAGCAAGVSALCVDSYGTVFPCARLRIPMGNLDYGISNVFRSEIYKNLNNRKLLKGRCSHCSFLFCCGGCRARAFALTNDYLEEDSHCITFIEKNNENNT